MSRQTQTSRTDGFDFDGSSMAVKLVGGTMCVSCGETRVVSVLVLVPVAYSVVRGSPMKPSSWELKTCVFSFRFEVILLLTRTILDSYDHLCFAVKIDSSGNPFWLVCALSYLRECTN